MKLRLTAMILLSLCLSQAFADEGMWLLGNLRKNKQAERVMKELGLQMPVNKLYNPKKPALAEAIALSFADNTDAKLETITEIYDKAEPTTEWLGFSRYVDSNVRQSSGYVQKKKGNKI